MGDALLMHVAQRQENLLDNPSDVWVIKGIVLQNMVEQFTAQDDLSYDIVIDLVF